MEEINDDKLWNIIADINWKGVCLNSKGCNYPYNIVGKVISEKYPEYIIQLRNFTKIERVKIVDFLTKHNIDCRVSDSGWDLTSHIVGCGKEYLYDVKNKVINGEYNYNNIYKKIKYKENFEYSFNCSLDYLIGSIDEYSYKEWLRNRKIDKIIN